MALNPALRKMVSSAKAKYSGGAGNAIKPKEGRNIYRILAPEFKDAAWVGENGQFWADLGVHWIKADLSGKPIAVVGDCDTVYQQPSVLNTAIEMALNNAMDEDSKKLYSEWKARKSVLINVIDRLNGDNEEVLELTTTTFGKVLDLITLYADAGQDITDPINGADIIISRTGKGLNTNYDVAIAPSIPGQPPKPVPKDALARAKDLHAFIAQNYFRGEEQKALNAIAQIAGIAVPRLTGASSAAPAIAARTPTAALASPAASVEDAKVDEPPAAPAGPTPEELAAAKRREQLLEQQRAAAAELAALEAESVASVQTPATTAAVATSTPAAAGIEALPASEADAILAELDNLC